MRVLIDLTDIERWEGHHGGIQRVVYGITKSLYQQADTLPFEIAFITFVDADREFVYSEFQPIYERVESRLEQAEGTEPPQSLKVKLRLGIREHIPEGVRKNKYARTAFKGSLSKTKLLYSQAKGLGAPRRVNSKVIFDKKDVVLVLGKPWDNLHIQSLLSKEKKIHNFKLVQVVYDLIISLYPHLHHPSLFAKYSKHMFEVVAHSDLLLPISKSSDKDLHEFSKRLNLPTPNTTVIRLGDDIVDKTKITKLAKPDTRVKDSFLLCVGTVEIRKNHLLLYNTYKLAHERGVELPQLVIVGAKGWLTHDVQYLMKKDPYIKEKFIILHNVDDGELSWLYENCEFTIYPSMYEGWGLPVAESLSYGKMCIASKTSSIPEIGGDLVQYFSPYSTEECLVAISQNLKKDTLREKERRIVQNYKLYTWSQTTEEIKALLQRLN